MKSTEIIAAPLLAALGKWRREQPKLVVAIDGHIGAGKTTLLKYVAAHDPDVLAIPKDDFLSERSERLQALKQAGDKVTALEQGGYDYDRLHEVIRLFREDAAPRSFPAHDKISGGITDRRTYDFRRSVLLMEGVLMFHPAHHDSLWGKRVYLESDPEVAADRRDRRDQEAFAKKGKRIPSRHDPKSLAFTFQKVLRKYREQHRPHEKADLVIAID